MNDKAGNISEELKKAALAAAANIVAGYANGRKLGEERLGALAAEVYSALAASASEGSSPGSQRPSVPIEDSVRPDYVVCLEDGKRLKMLKRYLKTRFGMTDKEYRAKWGLPPDYPMVAPNYAKKRSRLAKKIGLGK
jgi:predicted transcriptional regulator